MFSSAYLGKKKRMERIITNGRMLVVPVDDSLIFGPFEGLGNLSDTINSLLMQNQVQFLDIKAVIRFCMECQMGYNFLLLLMLLQAQLRADIYRRLRHALYWRHW